MPELRFSLDSRQKGPSSSSRIDKIGKNSLKTRGGTGVPPFLLLKLGVSSNKKAKFLGQVTESFALSDLPRYTVGATRKGKVTPL